MNPITDCEDCQALIEKYGEASLRICPFCDHLYYEECGCDGWDEWMYGDGKK